MDQRPCVLALLVREELDTLVSRFINTETETSITLDGGSTPSARLGGARESLIGDQGIRRATHAPQSDLEVAGVFIRERRIRRSCLLPAPPEAAPCTPTAYLPLNTNLASDVGALSHFFQVIQLSCLFSYLEADLH